MGNENGGTGGPNLYFHDGYLLPQELQASAMRNGRSLTIAPAEGLKHR